MRYLRSRLYARAVPLAQDEKFRALSIVLPRWTISLNNVQWRLREAHKHDAQWRKS